MLTATVAVAALLGIAALGGAINTVYRAWDARTQDALGATGSGGKLMQFDTMIPVTTILVAVIACAFDLRTRRIPNALTFGAALAALLFHRFIGGTEGAMVAAGGWLVGLCSVPAVLCAAAAWAAAT